MGAGHCPWGGYTDRIGCNIHGEEPKIMSIGPLAAAGEVVTDKKWLRTESQTIIMDAL